MFLKPTIKLDRITEITVELLKRNDIKALILDVDNTLSTHHGQNLTEGLGEWLEIMQKNGIALLVLSNSKRRRVEPFAAKIGLDFISLGLKPLPFGYIRALKRLGFKRKETAIVGDQIFTDILGGKAVGVKTVLLTPILPEDGWSFKIRRSLEKKIINKYNFEKTEV